MICTICGANAEWSGIVQGQETTLCFDCWDHLVGTGDEECDDEDDGEPVGSCDNCGGNIYADEHDDSGLCDQCSWWAAKARGEVE